tara:strand:+ start:42 stop:419 length:378 start_codon:yes stop_codon:yes gene_type:complete
MATKKEEKSFDYAKYQVKSDIKIIPIVIPETGDTFEITVKQMSWSKRNKLVSKCIQWSPDGENHFDGDMFVRESLKEMIVEAPWGKTTEGFLMSIDARLGLALENTVPDAFGDAKENDNDFVKKD